MAPTHPMLYQINTRARLSELSRSLGRAATLDDIDDTELDRLADQGFGWVWWLGVWQTDAAAQRVSRNHPGWRRDFELTLRDLRDEDIGGSVFAITSYTVHRALGGDAALARLRERMRRRGLSLMLDFVPNHVAPDHPWVDAHPQFFVEGSEDDLAHAPQNWCRLQTKAGARILAHGRDPHFDGWPDTLQLNYGKAQLQQAMIGELQRVAGQCDGLRCDMAMLVLPEVFERTWGVRSEPFWPKAIAAVRHHRPGFEFLAEVYWGLEWTLQQQGFDHTYDKRLVDRLRDGRAGPVREHLGAALDYQERLARFLENHDEPRAAASFTPEVHAAASLLCYATPGMRLFHQGQLEGARMRISPHLVRGPSEPVDAAIAQRYARLLAALRHPALRDGRWSLLDCLPAWDGNPTAEQFIAWAWQQPGRPQLWAAVNYAAQPGQCFVRLPAEGLEGQSWRLRDLLGPARYERAGDDLAARGLYLDLPAWGHHLFEATPLLVGCDEPAGRMRSMSAARSPADYVRHETLRDGTPVLIRPIRPDDRQRIITAFHNLEPATIYRRFFSAKRELTEADLGRIDANDFVRAAILVATLGSGDDEVIIGGGAYTVTGSAAGTPAAEMSFTVEEDYQGRGLASLFMRLLAEIGRERGIRRFEADVLAGNLGMLAVFEHSGLPLTKRAEGGVVHVEMDLAPSSPAASSA